MLLLVTVVLPGVTANIITYFYTKASLKDQAIDVNLKLISEGKENLSNYLQTIHHYMFALSTNDTLEGILSRGWTDYQSESYIMSAMQIVSRAEGGVRQVFLSVDKTNRSYLLYQDSFTKGSTNYQPILDGLIKPYGAAVESTHRSHEYGMKPPDLPKSEWVFTIHRPIYAVPSTNQIGMISVDIKLDVIKKLVTRLFDSEKEEFYILDNKGAVIYSSDESKIGDTLNEPWVDKIVGSLGSVDLRTPEFSGIAIYSKVELPMLEWTILKRVPNTSLYKSARDLILINLAIGVLFLGMAIIAIVIVSYRFTKPIKELIRWSSAIQSGNLEETMNINRTDEIGSLARRFKDMIQTINELILREYKLNLANKTNQLKILQAQINPHFIYNSLQSIGALALEYNTPKIYMLLMSMGQMMHYSMNAKETNVMLSKEIEYVNYYLTLQKQRFEEELLVDLNITEDTKHIQVPKMILQPIVENYFKHGKHNSSRIGHIKIQTFSEKEFLTIIVEDNGIGIPEERLLQIRNEFSRSKNHAFDHEGSIGLSNVLNRLRLYHGEGANLELINRKDGGLRVILKIPLINENRAEQ
ncbi:sensor histidine kinase [Ammoniphilus sp. YIM 78166]|uniref:cache domain-containing sensor histidine kinase n=1 Tax=Ammoniphilus sp. YIM 78166 TaxID=1644106 RepID=UPI001431AE55|nr:sensor histidine kinase [Ammoniphilus sp. YIM 78166]